jgi:hypothetical protein
MSDKDDYDHDEGRFRAVPPSFTEDERLTNARMDIEKAIQAYVDVKAEMVGERSTITVTSWAVSMEFSSLELSLFDMAGWDKTEKDNQMPSVTRGLFEFGVDAFRRG